MEGKYRCCRCCTAPCAGDFKKVADLQHSGLAIYMHTKKDEQNKAGATKYSSSFILHNTGSKNISRPDYIAELKRWKSKCLQCEAIVQHVRSLLDEIQHVRESEVIGICEHCKLASLMKVPCQRCKYVVNKFLAASQKRHEEKQQRFKIWLRNVKRLLQVIVDNENVSQHKVPKDSEFERILHVLKEPLETREPDIDFFPSLDQEQLPSYESLSKSKILLEELLSKIKLKGDTIHISSDISLHPSPSKQMCLCKYLKEGHFDGKLSSFTPGKTSGSQDTMLSGEPIKDLCKILSDQDLYKDLIGRLLELSKALPQSLHANKKLIQEILGTLNEVMNKGLTTNTILKLINQLKELHSTLPHDFSKDLSKDGIQQLINDLNDLLILGSSKNLNKDLIHLLVDLSDMLSQEISKKLNEEKQKISTRKDLYESHLSSRDMIKAKLSKISKDSLKMSPQSENIIQESPESQSKDIRQASPKSRETRSGMQMIPEGQSKDKEDDTQILPSIQSKKSLPGLSKSESKYGTDGLPRGLSKKSMQGIPKAQSKHSAHGMPRGQTEDEAQDALKKQNKDDEQELSKVLGKKSMQGLTTAQSKQSAHRLPGGQSEVDTQDVLKAQNIEAAQELSRGLSKKSVQSLAKAKSGHAVFRDETEDGKRGLSKGESKKSMQALPKTESRPSTHSLPQVQSQHEISPEKAKEPEAKISRQQIKKSMLALPKVQSKAVMEGSKDNDKGESKTSIKDGKRSLASVQSKDDTHDFPKDRSTDDTHDLSKASITDMKQSIDKDLQKASQKELKQDTSLTVPKEERPKSQIKLTPSLSKRSMAHLAKPQVSRKDLSKSQKDVKTESPRSKIQSIDTSNPLVEKLADLNKALASGVIDKNLIQELARDIDDTLGKKSSNLLNTIAKELTNLCKPAVHGIPKTSNLKQVQGLISDASKALGQGLSEDQNRKTVQGLLNDLNKALAAPTAPTGTKDQKQVSKELKSGISKDKSMALKPQYAKPPTKHDLQMIRALAAKEAKQGDNKNKGLMTDTDADKKVGTKTDKKPATSAESVPDGEVSPKKDLKSKKSPTRKSSPLESDGTSKKLSGKTRLELASKKGMKYKFGDDDDYLGLDEPSEKGSKRKSPREEKSKKDKENESPLEAKKSQDLKKKSKQKLSELELRRPKQLSHSVLLKLLSTNRLHAAKYAAYKEKKLAKEKEMEKMRLKELALKNIPVPKKAITPPSTPDNTSSSILQCNIKRAKPLKAMIKGETIVRYDPRYKDRKDTFTDKEPQPLLFKTQHKFSDDPIISEKSEYDPDIDYEAMFRDGITRYRLSSREFIDKGWTVLPTKKIMRRMNIYRMEPANPKHDWFECHKNDKELFYPSGQKLADIDQNGRGRWYYRNGNVALDYYNAKESNVGQRYVVYSSGTEMEETGKIKPRTILGLFDYLGNGVVYDHYGNVRLKYNQTEGVLVDPKLGAPGKWKWHSLNDPPVLQQVFVNTCLKEHDHKLDRIPKSDRALDASTVVKRAHPEMLAIEFDNFMKEKTSKMLRQFKPFQIRFKAVKLNDHFSLKIVDQACITLHFRDGATSLKLNLGMLLISDEIIDTDTSDMTEVSTPYDRHPPKTLSVENIQKILKTVKSGKVHPPLELTVSSVSQS